MDKRRHILWDARRYFFDSDIFFLLISTIYFRHSFVAQLCAISCSIYSEIQPYPLTPFFSKNDNSTQPVPTEKVIQLIVTMVIYSCQLQTTNTIHQPRATNPNISARVVGDQSRRRCVVSRIKFWFITQVQKKKKSSIITIYRRKKNVYIGPLKRCTKIPSIWNFGYYRVYRRYTRKLQNYSIL